MKTIEDVVMEHAKKDTFGTDNGLKMLELRDDPKNYTAANLYITALGQIRRLQAALAAAREE